MPLIYLDLSTRLVQNLKLVETMVDVGNEFLCRSRKHTDDAERERINAIARKALLKIRLNSAYDRHS